MSRVAYAGPIIDAHHHFWDLGDGHYPWLQDEYDEGFFLGDYRRLMRDFLPADYRRETAGFDIAGDVHIEAERSRKEQVAEADFLTRLHRETGLPTALVGHVGFLQPDRDEVLDRLMLNPLLRGIRSKPVTAPSADRTARLAGAPGTLLDAQWQTGLGALRERGLRWDLRVPAWHLAEAAEVLTGFPGLRVVLNHCGLPLDRSEAGLAVWREGMRRLAANPEVTVKVSELGLRGGEWAEESNRIVIRDTVEIFGWERSMFASNLPVSGLAVGFPDLVATVVDALEGATAEQLHRLFFATASEFYSLGL